MMKFLLSIATVFLLPSFASIDVTVTTTAPAKGDVHIAIYASEAAFVAEKADYGKVFELQSSNFKESSDDQRRHSQANDKVATAMDNLPPGEYVIAGYHDVNGNGKLDKNLMGIPTEPYGFSREPESKWSRPSWEELVEKIDGKRSAHAIVMKTWKER